MQASQNALAGGSPCSWTCVYVSEFHCVRKQCEASAGSFRLHKKILFCTTAWLVLAYRVTSRNGITFLMSFQNVSECVAIPERHYTYSESTNLLNEHKIATVYITVWRYWNLAVFNWDFLFVFQSIGWLFTMTRLVTNSQ